MKRTPLRGRAAAPVAALSALALSVSLSACGASNEQPSGSDSGSGSGSTLSGTINGVGSSAQEAAQAAWQAGFQTANPDVTVNYDPSGSGAGREAFIAGGKTSFAGSDSYLSTDEDEIGKAAKRCGGDAAIEVPDYVSPIALIYNLDGVDQLNLTADTVAGIFAGTITKWDDPAIAADNEGTDLPSTTITPVHRGDDSGTTDNFTQYLEEAAGDTWGKPADDVWPYKSGEAATGTSGVVEAVTNGANTIGYADESQAGDLSVANVKVGTDYVGPTAEAAAKVLQVSQRVKGRDAVDMATELDHATTTSGVYPITLVSYLIACPTYPDKNEAALVKGYLAYVVSDEGQQAAAKNAGSAPLPSDVQSEAADIVAKISAG